MPICEIVTKWTSGILPTTSVVLTEMEVALVLAELDGVVGLMLRLIYGSGLRVSECTHLRVKDHDFEQGLGHGARKQGDKDRTTLLPGWLIGPLKAHLECVKALPEKGACRGTGRPRLHLLAAGGGRPQGSTAGALRGAAGRAGRGGAVASPTRR